MKLDPQSYEAYTQGQEMTPFVPSSGHDDWLLLALENQALEVQLR
ncbi:hypothetical protein [Hymenobacter jeollabukensis]